MSDLDQLHEALRAANAIISQQADEAKRLQGLVDDLSAALQGVIDSACHPDIAHRAVMVDLAPVRKALKQYHTAYPPSSP